MLQISLRKRPGPPEEVKGKVYVYSLLGPRSHALGSAYVATTKKMDVFVHVSFCSAKMNSRMRWCCSAPAFCLDPTSDFKMSEDPRSGGI